MRKESSTIWNPPQSNQLLVTQQDLDEYQRLVDPARRHRELGDLLRDFLDKGAAVEPGRWAAELRRYEQRKITGKALELAFGRRYVQELKAKIPPTPIRQLIISDGAGELPQVR